MTFEDRSSCRPEDRPAWEPPCWYFLLSCALSCLPLPCFVRSPLVLQTFPLFSYVRCLLLLCCLLFARLAPFPRCSASLACCIQMQLTLRRLSDCKGPLNLHGCRLD
jgi:hypothetical protein